MPGHYFDKFANLRLFYGYMISHPGKKLLFMGGEIAHFIEWNYERELDWFLLEYDSHRTMQNYVEDLNAIYHKEPSLYELDHSPLGFEWIDSHNYMESIIVFMRKARNSDDFTITICNFTPVSRNQYRIGVPQQGIYYEILNSDLSKYGGTGKINEKEIKAQEIPCNARPYSIEIDLPPLSTLLIKIKQQTEDIEKTKITLTT